MKKILLALIPSILTGCLGIPRDIEPVSNFDLETYLGTWYEIARLDHRFERGMDHITAEYTLRDDGGVTVINQGYKRPENQWKNVKGKAYLVDQPHKGHLKVSFFGPFYGSYVIFDLDPETHAFVCGPNREYLWFLSRTPTVSHQQKERFVSRSKHLGFDLSKLIWVDQQNQPVK